MNIDPSTPNREVLIRYLADSGVNQQKEAAAEMRKMEAEIDVLKSIVKQRDNLIDKIHEELTRPSFIGRIVLWFKKGN